MPERIDPWRLAGRSGVVERQVPLAGMRRLAEYLLPDVKHKNASVQVIMRFSRDSQRRVIIQGELAAQLVLQCQRCLHGLQWPLQTEINLAVVTDDNAAAQVPREYDPLLVGREGISPANLVEDELILALPTAAHCQDDSCPRVPAALRGRNRPKNPFAKLREMDFGDDTPA